MRPGRAGVLLGLGLVAGLVLFCFVRPSRDVEPESLPTGHGSRAEGPAVLHAPPARPREPGDAGFAPVGPSSTPPSTQAPGAIVSLAGRVLLPDGKPATRARVYARPAAWNPRLQGTPATSDESGAFDFTDLGEPGEYALRAVLTEGGEWFGATTARAGEREVRLLLRAGVEADTVLVRVFGADGAPVAAAEGIFCTESSWSFARVERGRVFFDVGTREREDMTSAFVLISVPRGSRGEPLGSGDARLDGVRGGGMYEIRLPPESWISGRVIGSDGRGVPGTRLRAVRIDDGYREQPAMRHFRPQAWVGDDVVRSAEDGSFRIGRMGEGEHWILADPPDDFLPADPVRARSGAADALIALRQGMGAVIRVLDPNGNPLRGASVHASARGEVRDHSWPRTSWANERETGDDGATVVPHLERTAKLVLTVKAPAAIDDLLDHVEAGWTPSVTTVRLERGMPLGGVVRDTDGVVVGYVFVRCRESDGTLSRSQAEKDGRFRFAAMPAGTVDLAVEDAPSGSPGAVRVNAGRRDVVLTVAKAAPAPRK